MFRFRTLTLVIAVAAAGFAGCSSDNNATDLNGHDTVVADANDASVTDSGNDTAADNSTPDAAEDTGADSATDAVNETVDTAAQDADDDAATDITADGASDTVVIPDVAPGEFPARALPFKFTRPADGDAPTAEQVTAFTKKVTGLWKKIDWARWVLRTSTGVDATTDTDDYLGWHNDIAISKTGDVVTFRHMGGEHNMWIPGSKVLSEAIGGYLLTKDWKFAKLTEQYCKGLSAVIKGFRWGENDPAPYLMARAIFPHDHSFTLDETTWHDDGRKKEVKFSDMYHNEDGWNAHTFNWPQNPTWGDIWVTNMRSKDDVRSIVRTAAFIPYVLADAEDQWVKDACQETWDLLKGFNQDIIDSGYNIRTKDNQGNAYIIPCEDQDLGSYVCYTNLGVENECCQRISTDLIAQGKQLTEECGNCFGSIYDGFASAAHFYNIPIIWDYHMAAIANALVNLQARLAWDLMEGMTLRMDSYMHPTADEPGHKDHSWKKELAVMMVQAASVGLPLTGLEAQLIHQQWTGAIADFENWPNWDPWAATVPEGPISARPGSSEGGIDIEALTMFLEYCNSPFQNADGVAFIDCDIVKNPALWGQD